MVHNHRAVKNILLTLIALLGMGNCVLSAAWETPLSVEVWTGGDDGLTQRLRDEIENRFKASSHFVLSSGKKPGTLIVTIPTNVTWTAKGTRTHVRYKVEFSSAAGSRIGISSGSCWDDRLADCAAEIYRGAQKVAKSRH
jgi:hypothetical protein